jgi:ketosteroid isomerase-like protein
VRLGEFVDPEFVLVSPGVAMPEGGEWRGYEGFVRFGTAQMEAFSEMWVQPLEFIDVGEHVVVPVKLGGRARHTGIEVEFSTVHVWTLRHGKAVRLEMCPDKRTALRTLGVSG